MISTPTDRLDKFSAVGGILLFLAAAGGLFHQHKIVGEEENRFMGHVLELRATYNSLAIRAQDQFRRDVKLRDQTLTPSERKRLQEENDRFKEFALENYDVFEKNHSEAETQKFYVQHHHSIRRWWYAFFGAACALGFSLSLWGFRSWFRRAKHER